MIDFRLLRHFWYFLAVAEEEHFGKAAQRLGISQPPLSQQIQDLERLLGIQLFDRSRAGARLTPQGAAILEPVRRFMEHAQRLQTTVDEARHGRSDVISIGAINAALFDILPQLVRVAKQRYPQIALSITEMRSAQALNAVRSGEIDIALARFDDGISDLEVRPIIHDHLVLVLPVDHALAAHPQVSLASIADESLVLFPRHGSPSFFDQITSACRAAGFSPRVDYEISSVVSQIAYVSCGMGLGMVPSRSMRFGGADVTFRRLVETINVVSIAAAWQPRPQREIVSQIVEMAAEIGTRRPSTPVTPATKKRQQSELA